MIELEREFKLFLENLQDNLTKAEFYLPQVVANLILEGKAEVKVLKTPDSWFGVTYKEDKERVVESLKMLIDQGIYPEKLYD